MVSQLIPKSNQESNKFLTHSLLNTKQLLTASCPLYGFLIAILPLCKFMNIHIPKHKAFERFEK